MLLLKVIEFKTYRRDNILYYEVPLFTIPTYTVAAIPLNFRLRNIAGPIIVKEA